MKTYEEITERVLSRRNEYEEKQKLNRKRMIQISSVAGCFAVVLLVSVGVWQSEHFKENPLLDSEIITAECDDTTKSASGNINQTHEAFVPHLMETTSPQVTDLPPDEGSYSQGGDVIGGWFIPALPFDREIVTVGEEITDAEAKAYFEQNGDGIIASLSSSGAATDSITISEKGYCHVNYDGTEGKSFEVRQNFRDYLLYSGDKLIAIITLYKENGEIFNTPSFGAKWFDDYNAYLENHKGEELVYVYAKWFEIIVAPDNTYYNPMGLDVVPYLGGVEKPYEMFYHESAVYMP